MTDHEVILAEILTWLDPSEAAEQSDQLFELIADWAEGPDDGVTVLAFGETARHRGFDSEADYLAAVRRTVPMRPVTNRKSHLRWTPIVSGSAAARERLGANVRRSRAEAFRAVLPYRGGWTPRALVTP